MQVEVNVTCMYTSFGWCGLSGFGDMATFQKRPNFPFRASKNLFNRNRLKKFMQVGIDVKCMHADFGGRGLSSFGDMATFQKRPNFPFGAWTIVHGRDGSSTLVLVLKSALSTFFEVLDGAFKHLTKLSTCACACACT